MVVFAPLTFPLLLLLAVLPLLGATPVPAAPSSGSSNGASVTITTPLGDASGVADTSSVGRFAVRYATAGRWQKSVIATKWELPNNSTDPSALPLACPQQTSSENSANTDEDCLSMILYVPTTAVFGKVPAMMWIHGGSFIVGSATGPGLNGAALAQATGSIVAVVQYRLGALGFLSPNGDSNLAVKDMITALQFLQKVLPSFNGDTTKITIAGQSSGATMVRALLAAPSASGLFKGAGIHSDPMNFGFLSAGAFQTLNNYLKSQIPCNSGDTACLNSLSTDDIVNLTLQVFGAAPLLDASTGSSMPMRPVTDHSLITSPLDMTAPFPSQSKTIIVSTVRDEAGPAIYSALQDPVSEDDLPIIVNASLGPERTSTVLNSEHYAVSAADSKYVSSFDARSQLENIGTDQIWRCPSWTFARSWAAAGGKVFVGEYALGATYPDNEDIPFCTQGGTVCHEDDIKVVFGTETSPTNAQRTLNYQVQARMKQFFANGSPTARGFEKWNPVSGSDVNALVLGGPGGKAAVGACDPSFWGQEVPYDYQLFGI